MKRKLPDKINLCQNDSCISTAENGRKRDIRERERERIGKSTHKDLEM